MRIVACDDERLWLEELEQQLRECFKQHGLQLELKLFTDGRECYEYLQHNSADVVFMDIFLEQGTSMEFIKQLREQGFGFKLVFLTTSNEFANESYVLDASYYLLKPLKYEQLEQALKRCGVFEKDEYVVFDTGAQLVKIKPKNIIAVEVQDKYCYIHTSQKTYKVYSSINKVREQLTQDYFLLTYRSVLINMHYVEHMSSNSFLMSDGFEAPIRVRDAGAVRGAYMDWVFEHG